MSPVADNQIVVPDRELEEDNKPDESEPPRIRCPLCGWLSRKEDKWFCTCGHEWNTVDTGSLCPACLHQWRETQCFSCNHVGAGERQNGKRADANAIQGCLSVPPRLHSTTSRGSHEDGMVWRSLRVDEASVSVIEDAFPELRDDDRMRGSRHAQRNQARFR